MQRVAYSGRGVTAGPLAVCRMRAFVRSSCLLHSGPCTGAATSLFVQRGENKHFPSNAHSTSPRCSRGPARRCAAHLSCHLVKHAVYARCQCIDVSRCPRRSTTASYFRFYKATRTLKRSRTTRRRRTCERQHGALVPPSIRSVRRTPHAQPSRYLQMTVIRLSAISHNGTFIDGRHLAFALF